MPLPSGSTTESRLVLLVDVDARRAAQTAQTIGNGGKVFAVEHVSTAAEALSRLRAGPAPRVVVIERDPPDMDPGELARRIRWRTGERSTRTVIRGKAGELETPTSVLRDCDAYLVEDGGLEGAIAMLTITLLAAV